MSKAIGSISSASMQPPLNIGMPSTANGFTHRVFYYESITSDVRRSSFLLGRIAAKSALTRQPAACNLKPLKSGQGFSSSYRLRCSSQPSSGLHRPYPNHGMCTGVSCHPPNGIDLEDILPDRSQAMERQCSESELAMVKRCHPL